MKLADFKIPNEIPGAVHKKIESLLKRGNLFRYIDGVSEVTKLEKLFARKMGMKYALALNSCSSSIFISLLSLGIKPGDKVLVPGFTFAAVPSAVHHAGAIPILVEVNDNYTVNIEDFRIKIKNDIRAVVISHMRGHISDMDEIISMCKENKIPIIEDAAHSLGAYWKNKKSGTLGNVGCFSFQSYKLINSGEGGILVTNDTDIIARAIILSGGYENNWIKHDIEIGNVIKKYINRFPVYNLRLNNLSALVISSQLTTISKRAKLGLSKTSLLKSLISENKFISLPNIDARVTPAPDSLQFNLIGFSNKECLKLMSLVRSKGVQLHILGHEKGNARVFWNWKFLTYTPYLPKTKKILFRACDLRVPIQFSESKISKIADIIIKSIYEIKK